MSLSVERRRCRICPAFAVPDPFVIQTDYKHFARFLPSVVSHPERIGVKTAKRER